MYAKKDGESNEVSLAIEEHYLPLIAEGSIPKSPIGIIISLADKFDTLTADFSIGLIPTGSADPYGLRRFAIGIIRIIVEKKIAVSLKQVIEKAISILGVVPSQVSIQKQLTDFLKQRFENMLTSQNYRIDEIRIRSCRWI